MMSCTVHMKHVSACSNKSAHCLDVGPYDTIAFGCSNSVALYKPACLVKESKRHSVHTYNFHSGSVEAIKWIQNFDFPSQNGIRSNFLLSGASDGILACWQADEESLKASKFHTKSLHKVLDLSGHQDAIKSIDGMCVSVSSEQNKSLLYILVSAGADSILKFWHAYDSLPNLTLESQTFDFENKFVLDAKLHSLPANGGPLLACACDDFKIRLYIVVNMHDLSCRAAPIFAEALVLSGHEDWVRHFSFVNLDTHSILFTSCSQDCSIRIWKLQVHNKDEIEPSGNLLQVQKECFSVVTEFDNNITFAVTIEAVLLGHENWVYCAQWNRKGVDSDISRLQLLSSSIDKTVVLWEYDNESGMWLDNVRLGEVGGNTLGYYGAYFCDDDKCILSHSYSGSLYLWTLHDDCWETNVAISGHTSPVCDIDWAPNGHYLISASEDQTTRVYAEWNREVENLGSWHEFARPQIHGYNMSCLTAISDSVFVSGADEKVIRVFAAPENFLQNFAQLTGYIAEHCSLSNAPQGATVPALGLSNKAVFSSGDNTHMPEEKGRQEQYLENVFTPLTMWQPPSETDLLQNTLWPEMRKLYGHVYEVFTVTSNHAGTLVVSSAKSSQMQHSGLFVWNAESWQKLAVLIGHNLTVTQIEFSPDDKYILSVSRDRTWILHGAAKVDGTYSFAFLAKSEKPCCHSRIIWSCSWASDSCYFATASRDKKVMIWHVADSDNEKVIVSRKSVNVCKESVTAVAFNNCISENNVGNIVIIGHESGLIKICRMQDNKTCILVDLISLDTNLSHCLTVKRIKWRPECSNSNLSFATCSTDQQVKIFELIL